MKKRRDKLRVAQKSEKPSQKNQTFILNSIQEIHVSLYTYMSFIAWPKDNGQKIYRIDALKLEQSSPKKTYLYLK